MNSEELEQSLRAEFESYLQDLLSELKEELSGFREKFEEEFRQHQQRIDEALRHLESEALADREFPESFRETVTEHLRLAKDEGARITATAIAEAEELHGSSSGVDIGAAFGGLRDAVADISSKNSQAAILKSLVDHATEHTPRGAFFIVKNDYLVGWRVFGLEDHEEPDAVKELYFPLSSRTALSEAVDTLATVESVGEGFADAEVYLRRLGFEDAKKMVAIPLVARGRGVAVLYADCGENGGDVNSEALETLVRVAGLTVELLASGLHAPQAPVHQTAPEPAQIEHVEEPDPGESEPEPEVQESSWSAHYETEEEVEAQVTAEYPVAEPETTEVTPVQSGSGFPESAEVEEIEPEHFGSGPEPDYDRGFSFKPADPEPEEKLIEAEPVGDQTSAVPAEEIAETVTEEFAQPFQPPEVGLTAEEQFDAEVERLYEYEEPDTDEVTSDQASYPVAADKVTGESHPVETSFAMGSSSAEEPVAEVASEPGSLSYGSLSEEAERAEAEFEAAQQAQTAQPAQPVAAEPPVEAAVAAEGAPGVRRRFGDRNIDLPIEVPEEERQYHNSARRFARLLVSEIRLYNEQKVTEGCEANDLYDRLKEAIDRSREMYDNRVHGPVAARFDYFNYELVNNLAQGDESKLGDSYPGPTV